MIWTMFPGASPDMLGLIPEFFDPTDERRAKDQINESYAHGGGWFPAEPGFTIVRDPMGILAGLKSKYPEDKPYRPIGVTNLRDETIIVFESGWTAIVQPDDSFEVSRLD